MKREGAQIAINGTAPAANRAYAAAAPRTYAGRQARGTTVYATAGTYRHRAAVPAYAADDQGFYLRPALGYAPEPRGLGEWLMDPGGW